jgi:subtilisin-like proprotein convertase family protein
VRFDNNVSSAIPDLGTNNSTITVTGITTHIRQVAVSLHLTHSSLEDLDISLISPGGVTVDLSSDNGGTASDYGSACADNERTRFEDGAASLITASSAPFVGTFAPEGSLSDFQGEVGSNVNGNWTLRVVDDSGGSVGTLRCWSLFIAPTFCPPGSGPCQSCPERTIYGYLNHASPTMGLILPTNSNPSRFCGSTKTCSNTGMIPGQFHYDTYTFVNGESNACITVALEAPDCALFSAAYTNTFTPGSPCFRYIADIGRGTTSGGSNYTFRVAARARFVVVVNETVPNSGCQYALTVSGGSCRPVLEIDPLPNNQVAFEWSTAATGYALERTNALGQPSAPAWLPAPSSPVITQSRFRLTNTVTGARNFYRLRKP